jgi:hypothetical protein
MSSKLPSIKIEELPDRLAHLRKIAERIKPGRNSRPMIRSVMLKCWMAVTA